MTVGVRGGGRRRFWRAGFIQRADRRVCRTAGHADRLTRHGGMVVSRRREAGAREHGSRGRLDVAEEMPYQGIGKRDRPGLLERNARHALRRQRARPVEVEQRVTETPAHVRCPDLLRIQSLMRAQLSEDLRRHVVQFRRATSSRSAPRAQHRTRRQPRRRFRFFALRVVRTPGLGVPDVCTNRPHRARRLPHPSIRWPGKLLESKAPDPAPQVGRSYGFPPVHPTRRGLAQTTPLPSSSCNKTANRCVVRDARRCTLLRSGRPISPRFVTPATGPVHCRLAHSRR